MKGVGVLHRATATNKMIRLDTERMICMEVEKIVLWRKGLCDEYRMNTNTNTLKIKQVRLYNGSLTFIVQVQVHISSKSSTDKIGTEGYVSTYALVN